MLFSKLRSSLAKAYQPSDEKLYQEISSSFEAQLLNV